MSKSALVRVNKDTKELLDQLLKENPDIGSYADLLDSLLASKLSSKTIDVIKNFLASEKKCTNVVQDLTLDEKRVDVAGGCLINGKEAQTEFGYLVESELHLVQFKKSEEEVITGLSQLLLFRLMMQRSRCWVDNLNMYVAMEADIISDTIQELLRKYGIGLLLVSKGHISLAIEPKEQTNIITNRLKNHGRLGCENCSAEYTISEMWCKRCEHRLGFNIYDDIFQKTNIKITNTLQVAIATDPVLKKVFKDIKPALDSLQRETEFKKKGM